MSWKMLCKVAFHRDWTNTGASTAMWDTKCLVEVEMAYIRTNFSRTAKTNLSIHVGTIHVDLSTVLMDDLADGLDFGLEDTKCARIGDHHSCEIVFVFLAFLSQILDV